MPSNATRASDSPDNPRPAADPLERLRDRVERAVSEIERLREENVRLAERVRELAEHDALRQQGESAVKIPVIDGDPEALRAKIQGFIGALDRVLIERSEEPPPPSDA